MEGEGKPEYEDFGQTLASAGISEGAYIVALFWAAIRAVFCVGR